MTNYVFKELEKKRILWHKYLNNRTEENYLLYRSKNNKTKTCIVDARKNYEMVYFLVLINTFMPILAVA